MRIDDAPDAHAATLALVAAARAGPAAAVAASTIVGGEAAILAAGDADGDGKADILALTASSGRDGTVIGMSLWGSSAGERWRWGIAASFVEITPAVDLDGDGNTDVLVFHRDASGAWGLRALAGLHGDALWSRTAQSETDETAAPGVTVGRRAGNLLGVFVGPDADGDGGQDLWLTIGEEDLVAGAMVGEGYVGGRLAALFRAEVVSGATGALVSEIPMPVGPLGAAIALPSQDIDGDGLSDTVVSLVGSAGGGSSFVAVDAHGAPLWTYATPAASGIAFPIVDATGDGVSDVLVASEGARDAIELLSGSTGLPVWRHADPLYLVSLPGDVDGDGAADVLLLEGDTFGGSVDVHAMLLSGRTGALIYDARPYAIALPANGYVSVEYEILAGDLDGDRALDALLHVENGVGEERWTRETVALLASDASIAWIRAGAPARPMGDVTGDGITDAALAVIVEGDASVTLVDGATGATVWDQVVGRFAGVRLTAVGDVGGDGRADVLAALVATGGGGKGGGATTAVAAWDAEGAPVWAPGGGR